MASGFNGQSFAFHGYLPIEGGERAKTLKRLEQRIYNEGETQIFIETPYRNDKMVEDCLRYCRPQTRLCIALGITTGEESIRPFRWQSGPNANLRCPRRLVSFYCISKQ